MIDALSRSDRLKLAMIVATANATIPALGVLVSMLGSQPPSELQELTFVYSSFILPSALLLLVAHRWKPAWRSVPLAVAIGPLVLVAWGVIGGAAFGELAVVVSQSGVSPINATRYPTPAALESAMAREELVRSVGGVVSFWVACAAGSFLLTRYKGREESPRIPKDA